MVRDYRDLVVWQRAMELVVEVYRLTRLLSKEEAYVLTAQIRRAAISVPSNIAEGQGRNSSKEFVQFLSIAKGSKAELETQLELAVRIGYLQAEDCKRAMLLSQEVGKMLNALQTSLPVH